ncbi:MAG: succinoglycan exporter [Ascidiaceihabitans sp.]|jgi:succinoglycan exporter
MDRAAIFDAQTKAGIRMKPLVWAVLLQWLRIGINAFVFLIAARALSLEQFGAFATAFAMIKLTQGIHKAGIGETVVIKSATSLRLHALFGLALIAGIFLSTLYFLMAFGFGLATSFYVLGLIPTVLGISAVSDGLLRKRLNIRALALRTASAQGIAAMVALWSLYAGAGVVALVIFTVLNSTLSAIISIFLAGWIPTKFPAAKHIRLTFMTVLRISGRDVLNSGVMPLAQIGIGFFIGLPSAGAFQIATRVLSMLDALTLAPLRYLALPKFASLKNPTAFNVEINQCLRLSAICACWVWFGLASSTPQVLGLVVGDTHALAVTPILQALIPLGLCAALGMPFTQALIARGASKLILRRAILTFGLSATVTIPMLKYSGAHVAIALSLANTLVLSWFLREAFLKLSIHRSALIPILPALLSGGIMLLTVSLTPLPLLGRITLGTVTYLLVLTAFQFKTRKWLLA